MEANKAYQNKEYEEALFLYTDIIEDKYYSSDLFYNIANCHYKLGNLGKAKLFYHRALLLNPKHKESKQNLQLLGKSVNTASPTLSPLGKITYFFTQNQLILIGSFAFWVLIFLLIFMRSLLPKNKATLVLEILAPLVIFYSLFSLYFQRKIDPLHKKVMITTTNVNLYTAPATNSSQVAFLPLGDICRVIKERGNWSYLETKNEIRGWTLKDQVDIIWPVDFSL